MGRVKAHAKDNQLATKWNQRVDKDNPNRNQMGEWLHQILGHTGKKALYFAAQSKCLTLSTAITHRTEIYLLRKRMELG